MKHRTIIAITILMFIGIMLRDAYGQASKGWPPEIRTLEYQASIDKTQQLMLVYTPTSKKKQPLLVGLHTW